MPPFRTASRPERPAAESPSGPTDNARGWVADLHIHSRYSMACSRDLDLPNLSWWARRKGISLLGSGDFTHPAWREHLREHLAPAEPGLYRLRRDVQADVDRRLPAGLTGAAAPRFMLSVEIATIYKRDGRTRKVHHLIYLPDLDAVDRFATRLGRIGNLGADGRPILGLDSRDLLEMTLEAGPDGYLVPAHIWTPWFSALGSKSGFDAVADCYADLADHIFAVETGLSSDPAMNWRVSSLDRYRLVSNSDAHSPPALAREATVFTDDMDYFALRAALRSGDGLLGTIEFFPEEGKYHADGHRACGVNWTPDLTRANGGRCPACGKPLTVGVLSRVEDLADRPEGASPARPKQVTHLVALHQILGEIGGVGARSKTVTGQLNGLVAALGPELSILTDVPLDDVRRAGGELLAEAIRRLRRGDVHRVAGFDGEYGVIRLFSPGELGRTGAAVASADALFDVPAERAAPASADPLFGVPAERAAPAQLAATGPAKRRPGRSTGRGTPGPPSPAAPPPSPAPPRIAAPPSPHEPFEPMLAGMEEVGTGLLDRLDAMQRVAASAPGGPLMIVAGPGTGKTRTLTHRIAYLCAELGVHPEQCLAITFTRRAAEELRARLDALLGPVAADVTVATFHSLGTRILREHPAGAGLTPRFRVADEAERAAARVEAGEDEQRYVKLLRSRDLVDLDELVSLPLGLLRDDPALAAAYRSGWPWVFVDEYQDVDADQYALLRELVPADGNLCAIGDPDQAIYSFRGADVSYFLRFSQDFTDARTVRLTRSYRSSAPILAAAVQAIGPSSLVRGRRLDPARLDPDAPLLGRHATGSAADEAEFVARTVDALVGGVSHGSLDTGRVDGRSATAEALSFSDIAVLYRTDAQAAPVVDALSRAGIPVQKRSHDRLRDRPGVAAIARELRHSGPPGGSLEERVRRSGRLLAQRYSRSGDTGRAAPGGAGLVTAAPTLDNAAGIDPADLWAAVELLGPLARRCGDDLARFLGEIATGAEVDALDPRAEAVTLLTLHAAKGLEFPVVFIVGCEDGLLPLRLPGAVGTPPESVAEERRLFFVGLTRAKDRLFISHARRRFRYGAEREQKPSPFLDAIDSGLFERVGDESARRPRDRQLRLI